MQAQEQYRRFADTLIAAGANADPATRDMLRVVAENWRRLADEAAAPACADGSVLDFAREAKRLRARSA